MRISIAIAASLLACAAPAHSADFLFSFNSTPGAANVVPQAVAGTVTGRIFGLPDTGTGAATQVWIDSYSPNPLGASILATSWPEQIQNSFTVSGGQIVGGSYFAIRNDDFFGQFFDRLFINFDSNGGFVNYASIGSNGAVVASNAQGLAGVTFTRIGGAVPEPGTWAMMLLGFGAVGCALRRTRVRANYSAA